MNEKSVHPAFEPDDFEAATVQSAFLDFTARQISCGISLQHAAIFQVEPLFGSAIKTNEVIGLAIDGNIIAMAWCSAAFGLRFIITGEQAFVTDGISNF